MDVIRNYLKKSGKDRFWLAEQIGVSKHTVDGWFAGREIPKRAEIAIERIIGGPQPIDVKLSISDWQKLAKRAESEGKTVDEMIASIVKAVLILIMVFVPAWVARAF